MYSSNYPSFITQLNTPLPFHLGMTRTFQPSCNNYLSSIPLCPICQKDFILLESIKIIKKTSDPVIEFSCSCMKKKTSSSIHDYLNFLSNSIINNNVSQCFKHSGRNGNIICLNCELNMCSNCFSYHNSFEPTHIAKYAPGYNDITCRKHSKFCFDFCVECNEYVCRDCLKENIHTGHNMISLDEYWNSIYQNLKIKSTEELFKAFNTHFSYIQAFSAEQINKIGQLVDKLTEIQNKIKQKCLTIKKVNEELFELYQVCLNNFKNSKITPKISILHNMERLVLNLNENATDEVREQISSNQKNLNKIIADIDKEITECFFKFVCIDVKTNSNPNNEQNNNTSQINTTTSIENVSNNNKKNYSIMNNNSYSLSKESYFNNSKGNSYSRNNNNTKEINSVPLNISEETSFLQHKKYPENNQSHDKMLYEPKIPVKQNSMQKIELSKSSSSSDLGMDKIMSSGLLSENNHQVNEPTKPVNNSQLDLPKTVPDKPRISLYSKSTQEIVIDKLIPTSILLHSTKNGLLIIAGTKDNNIISIESQTSKIIQTLSLGKKVTTVIGNEVYEDNIIVSLNDHVIRLLNLESFQFSKNEYSSHSKGITSIILLPETSSFISSSKDKTIKIWDIPSCQCLTTFAGHKGEVTVIIVYNSNLIISGSADTLIKVWNINTSKCEYDFKGHQKMILTLCKGKDDKCRLVFSSGADLISKIWDIDNKICLATITGNETPINTSKWVGAFVITGDKNGVIKLWEEEAFECEQTINTGSQEAIMQLFDVKNGGQIVSVNIRGVVKFWI